MAAVPFVGHDPKPRRLGAVINMIAGAAITKGQVVGFHGTGVEYTVYPHLSASTVGPIGVAMHSQATAGEKVAIASFGCIVKVQNGVDSALEAGTTIMGDETTAGTVKAWTGISVSADEPIGFLLEAMAGDNVPVYAYIAPGFKMTVQSH
jgi:hypothetical protein